MNKVKELANQILGKFNLRLVRASEYSKLSGEYAILVNSDRVNRILTKVNPGLINSFDYPKMHSQLGQEFFILGVLNLRKNGYFVEFGATNGIAMSNTYVLERDFGWYGICAEPALNWKRELIRNRRCHIDFRCVYHTSGEMVYFKQTKIPELSTLAGFENGDFHTSNRSLGKYYDVETISLLDLLSTYNAPYDIDYVSIDTEGSELEILKAFDFKKFRVKAFTIEHNYSSNREKIFKLLTSHGYVRVYQEISDFDDWYLLKEYVRE